MTTFSEGCLVCGKPLVYFTSEKQMTCCGCGAVRSADAACADGHFVCDSCHGEPGFIVITQLAGGTDSRNPLAIATRLMENPAINMHGPEHHYLVPAALLAAFNNSGGNIDLPGALATAAQRAKKVPGGICGGWGCCGAAVGAGIFVSVATGATPLSEQEWSLANQMTADCLAVIAANGGPRCCKRNSYLAITQAAKFAKTSLGVAMELPEPPVCRFSRRNKQCRKDKCLYHAG